MTPFIQLLILLLSPPFSKAKIDVLTESNLHLKPCQAKIPAQICLVLALLFSTGFYFTGCLQLLTREQDGQHEWPYGKVGQEWSAYTHTLTVTHLHLHTKQSKIKSRLHHPISWKGIS